MLKFLGAELELTPAAKGMRGSIERSEEILAANPKAITRRCSARQGDRGQRKGRTSTSCQSWERGGSGRPARHVLGDAETGALLVKADPKPIGKHWAFRQVAPSFVRRTAFLFGAPPSFFEATSGLFGATLSSR